MTTNPCELERASATLVAVDLGNTHTRIALIGSTSPSEGDITTTSHHGTGNEPASRSHLQVLTQHTLPTAQVVAGDWPDLPRWIGEVRLPWYVSSVHRAALDRLTEWHRCYRLAGPPPGPVDLPSMHILTPLDFGLPIHLPEPDRVGTDRLAAAAAAVALRQDVSHGLIVVDAGTAITVDSVDRQGAFVGGTILAGPALALQALSAASDRLPSVALERDAPAPPIIGTDTASALRSGAYWGAVGAVQALIERSQKAAGYVCEVLLTGGFGRQLAAELRLDAAYHPDLVLLGTALAGLAHRANRLPGHRS